MIPWESIAFFAVRGRMAFVALHSGESRQLQVIQGSRITGRAATRDIAHVLVERANVVLNEMGKPAKSNFETFGRRLAPAEALSTSVAFARSQRCCSSRRATAAWQSQSSGSEASSDTGPAPDTECGSDARRWSAGRFGRRRRSLRVRRAALRRAG